MKVIGIIPCYNSGKLLLSAASSLLDQTYPLTHLYVVNDCSTDEETIAALDELRSHSRVQVVDNKINLGKPESINMIFDTVKADYYILQDQDDKSLPYRVESQIKFMDDNPDVGVSSSFVQYINASDRPVGHAKLDVISRKILNSYLNSKEPFALFCTSLIVKGSCLRSTGLRFRKAFWPAEDIDFWNRVAETKWAVLAQPQELVDYRIHAGSFVAGNLFQTRYQFEFVRHSLRCRRDGKNEPTPADFQTYWDSAPPIRKLDRFRKTLAKSFYRSAGCHFGNGSYLRAALYFACSCTLQPGYSIKRILQQSRTHA
jgi:glycosyltransferase involved in cell wall biosynthesis